MNQFDLLPCLDTEEMAAARRAKKADSHDPDKVLVELVSAEQAEQQTLGQLKQLLEAALGGDA